ncbi:unnamed protein product [Caenorhabditis angaria]|uniref:F-box domain-containing protein n=1 Tax=Caenorhabditis angaria TaxID=860376 RepID=A0A9P1MZA3_9PELO|nr:unnamed protein product [Caenorhabditis angaria]
MEPSASGTMALRDRDPEDETTFNFDDLPIRIIELIFQYLETYEIVKMRRVLPSFKDYIDELPKTKSSIRPFEMNIDNNRFSFCRNDLSATFRTLEYPYYYPNYHRIYEDVQLNWIRPFTITYRSSNVLESSTKFREFLRNVWKFEVYSIAKGEKSLDNFCKNIEFIENLQDFKCFDWELKEEEVVKIISSIKDTYNCFQLTLHQNLPFLTQPIIDCFFKITHGKRAELHISNEEISNRTRFNGSKEMWRDGIFRFFDYKYEEEETRNVTKILQFSNCERSTGLTIVSVLHRKFNEQSINRTTPNYSSLRFGNRILICKHIF